MHEYNNLAGQRVFQHTRTSNAVCFVHVQFVQIDEVNAPMHLLTKQYCYKSNDRKEINGHWILLLLPYPLVIFCESSRILSKVRDWLGVRLGTFEVERFRTGNLLLTAQFGRSVWVVCYRLITHEIYFVDSLTLADID